MKRSRSYLHAPSALFLTLISVAAANAQENGYINGGRSLFSFDPSTGAIVSSVSGAGTAAPLGVAADDATLYQYAGVSAAGSLRKVNGPSGQETGSVSISGSLAWSVLLSKDGKTAYVPSVGNSLAVVDTGTMTVTGTIVDAGTYDAALSPDGSILYVSIYCSSICTPPPTCHVHVGVGAYDATTLAFKWKVEDVFGLLSVSADGTTLYVAAQLMAGKPQYPLSAINTATLAVTNLGVSTTHDDFPSRVITDPVDHYAVIVKQGNTRSSTSPASAYILDTSTNTLVKTLFASAPGGMILSNTFGGAAFAPDGKSVWMLLSCGVNEVPNCSDESGQLYLAGFSVPSGTMISYQALPGEFADVIAEYQSIAFPR